MDIGSKEQQILDQEYQLYGKPNLQRGYEYQTSQLALSHLVTKWPDF